jgi:serine/threonine-protein kinase
MPPRPKKFQLAIPDYFEDVVIKMLAKEPGERFQTPTELVNQLERIAKLQTRTVWQPAAGAQAHSEEQPAALATDSGVIPQVGRSSGNEPPPSTHFFKNVLAGLLDEQSVPQESGVDKLRELVGKTIYQYEVKRVLARGKTSMVFLAEHTAKKLVVALKVLYPELSHKEEETQRFVRSVKTMLSIRHPNIVQLYDAGRTDGNCWMAMEYVQGASLTRVIKEVGVNGMLDWRDALIVGIHISRALQEAFAHHIIHRNIQPANILIRSSDNVAKLADLTLAKALEGRLADPITGIGQLIGDLVYMAPERTIANGNIDARSDIYSLGATIYTLICGRLPFEGHTLPDLVGRIRKNVPPSPRQFQALMPELFERVILKALAKRPEDRYQSPGSLLADLERIAAAEGIDA